MLYIRVFDAPEEEKEHLMMHQGSCTKPNENSIQSPISGISRTRIALHSLTKNDILSVILVQIS